MDLNQDLHYIYTRYHVKTHTTFTLCINPHQKAMDLWVGHRLSSRSLNPSNPNAGVVPAINSVGATRAQPDCRSPLAYHILLTRVSLEDWKVWLERQRRELLLIVKEKALSCAPGLVPLPDWGAVSRELGAHEPSLKHTPSVHRFLSPSLAFSPSHNLPIPRTIIMATQADEDLRQKLEYFCQSASPQDREALPRFLATKPPRNATPNSVIPLTEEALIRLDLARQLQNSIREVNGVPGWKFSASHLGVIFVMPLDILKQIARTGIVPNLRSGAADTHLQRVSDLIKECRLTSF